MCRIFKSQNYATFVIPEGIRTLIDSRDEPSTSSRITDQPRQGELAQVVETSVSEDVAEANVIFRPDTVPTQRHILYQVRKTKLIFKLAFTCGPARYVADRGKE